MTETGTEGTRTLALFTAPCLRLWAAEARRNPRRLGPMTSSELNEPKLAEAYFQMGICQFLLDIASRVSSEARRSRTKACTGPGAVGLAAWKCRPSEAGIGSVVDAMMERSSLPVSRAARPLQRFPGARTNSGEAGRRAVGASNNPRQVRQRNDKPRWTPSLY